MQTLFYDNIQHILSIFEKEKRMARYNLNLAKAHCSHWGLWEAIREILQNGEDKFMLSPSSTLNVEYSKSKKMITISNKNASLSRKSLLIGYSKKESSPDCEEADSSKIIGKFGEGYKIALLLLTKMNKSVVIKNYGKNEKWTPVLQKEKKYENEYVLSVDIKSYLFKGDRGDYLSWEIGNISEEEWEAISENYLRTQEKGEVFKFSNGAELLLDEKYRGKVFVNGLFVEKAKEKLMFGYNLIASDIPLDRDRSSIDTNSFKFVSCYYILEYAEDNEQNAKRIANNVMNDSSGEDFLEFQLIGYSTIDKESKIIKEVKSSFEEDNDSFFPVSTEREKEDALNSYPELKTKIVSSSQKKMLDKNEDYKSVEAFAKIKGIEKAENVNEVKESIILLFQELPEYLIEYYDISTLKKKLLSASDNWVIKNDENIEKEVTETSGMIEDSNQFFENEETESSDTILLERKTVVLDSDDFNNDDDDDDDDVNNWDLSNLSNLSNVADFFDSNNGEKKLDDLIEQAMEDGSESEIPF